MALAADWLAAAWDQNGWNEATSPGAAALECKAVAGLLSVLGLPTAAEVGPLMEGLRTRDCMLRRVSLHRDVAVRTGLHFAANSHA